MNIKNAFKSLAFAMLMPAMLFTTSCGNEDEVINGGDAAKQGYTLPVTVNVTRQGDKAATRATYDATTKKLSFSEGDKLFVEGYDSNGDQFAGTLDYDATSGKFSGNIATKGEWDSADDLFNEAIGVTATLLPAGYESYGFLVIVSTGEPYDAYLDYDNYVNAIAADKATAIEQFSLEQAETYSSGFALAPQNAIVNITYKNDGKAADDTWYPLLTFDDNEFYGGFVEMTFDEGGISTFAIAVKKELGEVEWTLTDYGDINVSLGNRNLLPGHIYNWTNVQLLLLTVSDPDTYVGGDKTIYYLPGETWRQAIENHPIDNAGWIFYSDCFPTFTGYTNDATVCDGFDYVYDDVIDGSVSYYFEK